MKLNTAFMAIVFVLISPMAQAQTHGGYSLENPTADIDGVTRVLIYHDMEGLAGQDDYRTAGYFAKDYYPLGQQYLADDINAVVDGLFAGGADEVDVVDAHGSGNPEPDLRADLLDSRARQVLRDQPFRPYADLSTAGAYDAVVAVGMHAKIGSNGFLSHTYSLGTDIILNGMSITETELIAFSFGRVGVPVIFVSGDDYLRKDLARMHWIEYAEVKQADGALAIRHLVPVEKAHKMMREKARRAMLNLSDMKVLKLQTPVAAALRVTYPASLRSLAEVPGVQFSVHDGDERVDFIAQDFQEAYDGIIALIGVSGGGRIGLLTEVIANESNYTSLMYQFLMTMYTRAFGFEAGEYQPEARVQTGPRKYHGVQ